MRSLTLSACVCLAALSPAAVYAQAHGDHGGHGAHAEAASGKPINSMCPVGGEPIEADGGTVQYRGKTIGLCCAKCGDKFLGWSDAKKDEFVAMAASHQQPGQDHNAAGHDDPEAWAGPYTLETCPISGQKLGSMGAPAVREYDGREVRFCCKGCIKDFEADLAASWAAVDEAMIEDQMRYYPTEVCVVSDEPLVEDGEDIATNIVYNNRLIRLCCKMCKRKFKADPAKFIEKLDQAAADAQRDHYPLKTCPVSGGALGSMGEPDEMVVAGRLMRFCCASCRPKVEANPLKYVQMIDAAWQAQGMFMPGMTEIDHADHNDDHTDQEDGHGHDHDH